MTAGLYGDKLIKTDHQEDDMGKTITRSELEKMYVEYSSRVVAKKLGVSVPYVYKLLKEAEIPLRGSGRRMDKKITVVEDRDGRQ